MPLSQRQQLIQTFLSLDFPADEAALLADAELRKQQSAKRSSRALPPSSPDKRRAHRQTLRI